MAFRDLLRQKTFGKQQIEPIYLEWVTREITGIIQDAQRDLAKVFTHSLVISDNGENFEPTSHNCLFTDAAIAVTATGVGLAAVPTFASMSIASAGGFLGILGLTTISWPIVAIGVATVGSLLALGGYKAAVLKSNAVAKYRNKMRVIIKEQVLGYNRETRSIRERLQSHIETGTTKILQEIDKC
jgi:hypothetical protein